MIPYDPQANESSKTYLDYIHKVNKVSIWLQLLDYVCNQQSRAQIINSISNTLLLMPLARLISVQVCCHMLLHWYLTVVHYLNLNSSTSQALFSSTQNQVVKSPDFPCPQVNRCSAVSVMLDLWCQMEVEKIYREQITNVIHLRQQGQSKACS